MNELIEKAINGDTNAFTMLILNYKQDLYKIALTKLHTEYDIDEAIQETLISAFQNIKNLKDKKKFKSWIIKILINKCNDVYKKRKYKLVSFENVENYQITHEPYSEIDSKLDFYSIINSLNDDNEKIIMVLYYNNKFTTKEISEILNKKENTIKTILYRAKIKLRNKYNMLTESNYKIKDKGDDVYGKRD